jgi:site-specific DNA-methyltransferase (adenine-specific)
MTTLDKISQDLRDLLSSISDPEIKEAVAKDFISFIDTLEPKGKSEYINQMLKGDCLEVMKGIPDGSVDLILCDLPYGTTACKWDTIIPFEPLWEQYKRVIKPNGAIVLTASQPFTTALINSNISMFRYSLIWDKVGTTGFQNAKRMPLRRHEDILLFYSKLPTYNPEMSIRGKTRKKGGSKVDNGCYADLRSVATTNNTYYPTSIINISNASKKGLIHPTQKPVALFEYLIKTYTNEGEVVLDNCSGSGTTAIAALNTGRKYICIEKDDKYHAIGVNRVKEWFSTKGQTSEQVSSELEKRVPLIQ